MQQTLEPFDYQETTPSTSLNKAIFTIWFNPRQTIRNIVDHKPDYGVFLLASLSGTARFLDQASERSLGDLLSLTYLLGIAIFFGIIFGNAFQSISAALFRWTGRWFGGKADHRDLRAAIAWSSIPDVFLLVVYIVLVLLTGKNWFISTPTINPQMLEWIILFIVPLGALILLFRFILLVKCVAEVHEFSAWKGLLTVLTGWLTIALPFAFYLLIR